ncbi:MAG: hypothetical protein SH847_24260 [Roseiflexaceae bacterium]|nr:hypothetical protein [Roseiflexaceae bacterium]
MRRMIFFLLMTLLSGGMLLGPTPASAAAGDRCFSETGFCIAGGIRTYWERNGGLQVFGYPISPLRTETNNDNWNGPTQWFQRDRLEDHAAQGIGVLAGRLGARYLELQGRSWDAYERVSKAPNPNFCRYFPITGHSLCGAFLTYWERNGGLERFGYPITEPMQENLAEFSGTAQYFERRRMELHPELAGTQYEVLLGLLGRDLHDPYGCKPVVSNLQKTAAAYPDLFGCPAPFPQVSAALVTQSYERGQMVWIKGVSNNWIWVFYYDNARGSLVWELYQDQWHEGEPASGGETPPAGLIEPQRGFGKLWRSDPKIRSTLGWAVTNEFADIGHQQYFRGGAWMLYRAAPDRVYLMRPDGRADDIARIK